MKKRVADIVIETVIEKGIVDCFAVVGGGAMYLDNALYKNNKITKYFNHHEQACAIAAEGYAKMYGKIPMICVTSGPGTTNTLTGVMGAWVDSVPMLIISGQMRYDVTVAATGLPLRFRGNQEFNIVDTVKTMTKYSKMVINPKEIKMEVEKAIDIALSGRRGPVWLDIPLDVQMAEVEESDLVKYTDYVKLPKISIEDKVELIEKLKKAKRPVIIAGNGIANSGNLENFREFARINRIPVVSAALAADALNRDDERYFGISGFIGPRCGNFVLQNSDFILAMGTSLGFKTTGYVQSEFAKNAYVVMVDVDEYEVKKPGVRVNKFIHSDLKAFFEELKDYKYDDSGISDWLEYCQKVKDRFSPFEATNGLEMNERVCSYYFWQEFEKFESSDSIVALGNNTGITAKLQIGIKQANQRVIANNNCGSMGYDLPAAIGAAVAAKREVICVTGDGSIMMNLQELQTVIHYNIPVKLVIFSNDGYNAIRQTSKNFFNGEYIGCTADTGVSFPDFGKVAETFGYDFHVCHNNQEIDESIKWLLDNKKQCILVINQRFDDPVTPKVMSRVDENGKFVTPAIQDMYPFIDENELKSLMLK